MANNVNITVTATNQTQSGFASVNQALQNMAQQASGAGSATGALKGSLAGLSTAVVPLAASVAPLAATLGAAAVALGAFGVAAAGQVKDLSEAAEAATKYEEAVAEHGRTSAEAAKADLAHARALEDLPKATRRAAAGFQVLKDDFDAWSDSLADSTMPVFTKSFALFSALLPKTTGLVEGASRELDRLVTIVGGAISTPGFDRLMDNFTEFATGALARVTRGVVELSRRLNDSEVGGALGEFMDFARENGPLVVETLRNLGAALTNLLVASAEAGVGMLQIVNALSAMVAAVPPEFLTTLIQVATAMKLISLAGAGMSAAGQGLARISEQLMVMRGAAAGAATRMGGLRAALGTLSTGAKVGVVAGAFVLLAVGIQKAADAARGAPPEVDKLTTSLKSLAANGDFSGELEATFGSLDGLSTKLHDAHINAGAFDGINKALGGTLGETAQKMFDLADSFVRGDESAKALREDFAGFDKSLAGLVSSGNMDAAKAGFELMKEAAAANGMSVADLRRRLPEYTAALEAHRAAQELAAAGMGLFGEQALKVQEKLADQKASADGLRQSIQALNEVQRQGLGGMIGFEAAIDAASEAAREHAGALDMVDGKLNLNDEASRTAATALQNLATKTDEAAASARESGQSWEQVRGIYERGRQQLIANAIQMGLNEKQAKRLADQILKTPNKTAYLKGNVEDLKDKIAEAKRRLRDKDLTDPERTRIRANISQLQRKLRQAQGQINGMHGTTIPVFINQIYRTFGTVANAMFKAHGGVVDGRAMGGVIGGKAAGGVAGRAAAGGPRGSLTLVGEMGPELVSLPAGSTVRTAGDSQRMMRDTMRDARGGGRTVLEIRSGGSGLDDLLLEVLRKSIRTRGGDVQVVLGGRG